MRTSRSDMRLMGLDWKKYLLHRRSEYDAFRLENETLVRERSAAFRQWVLSLPWMKWVPLSFRSEQEARAAIGLICVLYWDKEINISFSSDMRCIRNEPMTDSEFTEYLVSSGYHLPGTQKKGKKK